MGREKPAFLARYSTTAIPARQGLLLLCMVSTGKSLSKALLFCRTLFWMSETISVHNMFSPGLSLVFSCNSMNNLSPYCGLVDAKIRASDKEVSSKFWSSPFMSDELCDQGRWFCFSFRKIFWIFFWRWLHWGSNFCWNSLPARSTSIWKLWSGRSHSLEILF